MQAARKEEVCSMENERTEIEGRLDRIEVVVVETKSEVKELQTRVGGIETQVVEIKSGIKEIDTRSDVRGLQHDVKNLLRHALQLHGEMKELRNRIEELRNRMEDGFQSLRKEIGDAKIWALFIAATMLGVLARGFHWI
jgi:predicted  nucleic acid-binding Zn-ribbon protein